MVRRARGALLFLLLLDCRRADPWVIEGRVEDADTSSPVVGAALELRCPAATAKEWPTIERPARMATTTDVEGRYRFTGRTSVVAFGCALAVTTAGRSWTGTPSCTMPLHEGGCGYAVDTVRLPSASPGGPK